MKPIHATIAPILFFGLSLAVLGVEFPGAKDEQKVIIVMADGKVLAEVKILQPSTIDAIGSDLSQFAQPGGKHTMKIRSGSVEIRPEKGDPIKIEGELIYINGLGKPAEKK